MGRKISGLFGVLILIVLIQDIFAWRVTKLMKVQRPKKTFILIKNSPKTDIIQDKMFSMPPWFPSCATASLGGLMFGLDIGSSSSVLRILGQGNTEFGELSSFQLGEVASASLLGAILSSVGITILGDKSIGRKTELLTASIGFIAGTLVQSFSPSFVPELAGRLIYGLGIGVAMHVAPLFIAETSPDRLRGKLISFKEAAIVLGIVTGYCFGAVFGESGNWRGVFEAALPFEVLMLAGALIVNESPRWLALRNRKDEAINSLRNTQAISVEEAENAVNNMIVKAKPDKPDSREDNALTMFREIFGSKYNRRALFIGIGLVLFQQLSGQPSVLYFANRIFEQAGLGFQAAVGVGLFKLLMTSISATLVENPNFGRKSLLLYGNIGITVSLLLLSFLYGSASPHVNGFINPIQSQLGIIAAMFLFVGSYQIGFGPITWLILSEIFPLRVRSGAVSIGTFTNFASNLLITLLFETERQLFGESVLFFQFGIIGLLSVLFTSFYVFETRGLSLEQIESKLQDEVDK